MGVPSLFSFYFQKYKKENDLLTTLNDLCKLNVEYLFFDYNSLIHPCAQQILSANYDKYIESAADLNLDKIEDDIITNCINYTKFIINSINVKNVYIVIDGVAPRSKMNQQKERRYKSYFFKELENEICKISLWDSNKITPGTIFMDKLISKLKTWSKTIKETCKINFSDSNEPGEGEHKMMKIITNKPLFNLENSGKILIYGLDADLIFLSMLNKNSDNIILIRDTSFQDSEKQKNTRLALDYLNIKQLKKYIIDDFMYLHPNKNLDKNNLIQDYVLICFLLGNDFLDHLYCIYIKNHGIDILIKAYIKAYNNNNNNNNSQYVNYYLVNLKKLTEPEESWKDCINLIFLKDIFYQLKNFEEYYIKNKKSNVCKINMEKIIKVNNDENSKLFFYINKNLEGSFDERSFKIIHNNFYCINNKIDDICFNYIEGLYWILGYYNGHIHNNWSWYYKYTTVPFCEDLLNFLKKNNKNIINNIIQDEPFSNIKQLCLVLPKISIIKEAKLNKNFNKITTIINNKNKYISELFPDKLYVDIIDKEFLWQSKILFKPINEELLDCLL